MTVILYGLNSCNSLTQLGVEAGVVFHWHRLCFFGGGGFSPIFSCVDFDVDYGMYVFTLGWVGFKVGVMGGANIVFGGGGGGVVLEVCLVCVIVGWE